MTESTFKFEFVQPEFFYDGWGTVCASRSV